MGSRIAKHLLKKHLQTTTADSVDMYPFPCNAAERDPSKASDKRVWAEFMRKSLASFFVSSWPSSCPCKLRVEFVLTHSKLLQKFKRFACTSSLTAITAETSQNQIDLTEHVCSGSKDKS